MLPQQLPLKLRRPGRVIRWLGGGKGGGKAGAAILGRGELSLNVSVRRPSPND